MVAVAAAPQPCPGAPHLCGATGKGSRSRRRKAISVRSGGRAEPASLGMALSHAAACGPDCERSMAWAGGGKVGNSSLSRKWVGQAREAIRCRGRVWPMDGAVNRRDGSNCIWALCHIAWAGVSCLDNVLAAVWVRSRAAALPGKRRLLQCRPKSSRLQTTWHQARGWRGVAQGRSRYGRGSGAGLRRRDQGQGQKAAKERAAAKESNADQRDAKAVMLGPRMTARTARAREQTRSSQRKRPHGSNGRRALWQGQL